MVKYSSKFAYTMLEACIVMLIVSIFIAVTANVIPRKMKPKTESEMHGRFECYYNGDKLEQKLTLMDKSTTTDVTENRYCEFTPPKYIKFLIINAVGGASGPGGSVGQFLSTFYTSTNDTYIIKPGAKGSAESNGGDTKVEKKNEGSSDDTILIAEGGKYTAGIDGYKNTTIDDVIRCEITVGPKIGDDNILSKDFICASGPICEIENDKIKVSHCRTNELYRTIYIPYKRSNSGYQAGVYVGDSESGLFDMQYIVNSPYPKQGTEENKWTLDSENGTGTLIYYDASIYTDYGTEPPEDWDPITNRTSPSLFKLTLTVKANQNNATSRMENYIKMLQINDGIGSVHPGSIVESTSYPGAVLILW